jgi:hypothetical protein
MDNNDVYADHSEVGYYLNEETAEKMKESTRKELIFSYYETYIEEIEVNED